MRPAQSGPIEGLRVYPLELAVLRPATKLRDLGLKGMQFLFVSHRADGATAHERGLARRLETQRRQHRDLGHPREALGVVRIAAEQDLAFAGDERAFNDGFLALLGNEARQILRLP